MKYLTLIALGVLCGTSSLATAQPSEPRRGMTWDALLNRADRNGNGRVEREEFKGPAALFERLDLDRDAVVTRDEHAQSRSPAPKATESTKAVAVSTLTPKYIDVRYGSYERNTLDFWQGDATTPTPLVLFVHGGGFIGGDKQQMDADSLRKLLSEGISVAAINYRLLAQSHLPAAHEDVARALQFIRFKAKEWNVDKSRIGAMGGSAGAQLVMYLAFGDDRANEASDDAIARESTRLTCVAPSAAQVTMDMHWWDKHIPGYATKVSRRRTIEELYGTSDASVARNINERIAPIALISRGDPPIFLSYTMSPDDPIPEDSSAMNWMIHHVNHGIELEKKCKELGVEVHLKYPSATTAYASALEFLVAKLGPSDGESSKRRLPPTMRNLGKQDATNPAPGAWAEAIDEPDGMKYRTFPSTLAGTDVSYLIYLPPDYEANANQRYPVVYWLHGRGGSQTSAGQLTRRLDPAIRQGKASPMIVVGVNGLRTSSFVDSADKSYPVQSVMIEELIPHIDATYRTMATREGRGIEGFSMGGAGAAKIGFKYPHLFGTVSIMAGALHDLESYRARGSAFQEIYGGDAAYFEANNPWQLIKSNADSIRGRTSIRITVGGKDGLEGRNTSFHQLLDELKIDHDFAVIEDAPHSPGPLFDGLGDRTWVFFSQAFKLDSRLKK